MPAALQYPLDVSRRTPVAASIFLSDHPSRPRARTCCLFSSLKTLAIPATDHSVHRLVNVSAHYIRLAGFEVSAPGRFWVSPEGQSGKRWQRRETVYEIGSTPGAAMKVVQELLGHATIEMTNRYSHLSPEVPRDAVKLLDGLAAVPETEKKNPGRPKELLGDGWATRPNSALE
jgi:hypothetical protein